MGTGLRICQVELRISSCVCVNSQEKMCPVHLYYPVYLVDRNFLVQKYMHIRISPRKACNPCGYTMKISSRYHRLLIYDIKRTTKLDGMGPFKVVYFDYNISVHLYQTFACIKVKNVVL